VPVKPFCGVIVMMVVPEAPLVKLRDEVLVVIAMPGVPVIGTDVNVKVAVVVRASDPLVPVIVTA
jgi:hypothetical protein